MSSAPVSPSRTHNLPAPLSSFIGRRSEIAEVRQLLRVQRLVTLTGAGGCGKTRLALHVATDARAAFEDGVWLVEFAPLADPTLVPQEVASALGVREQSGRPLMHTLADYLSSRHVLLVLDNCEHLVEACARFVAALLQACPELTILATSREPLGVDGETVWTVPPLTLPKPHPGQALTDGHDAKIVEEQSEAIQLLVARAQAASPEFKLTMENVAAVEEICRRLDGMPLAIELAAARVRALTVQEVAERLDDRFHLLTGGSRTAPARQQTLEATLDWSYALLSEPERQVLRRLSAFAGGCTLQAAEAVCSGEDLAAGQVLDLLSRLVDKSLVLADLTGGEGRYRLLETVREYASRQLTKSDELQATRDRHLQYYLEWAEAAEPSLHGEAQIAWLERFEVEHDNLRLALEWSQRDAARAESGLRLGAVTGDFWQLHGHQGEGRLRLTTMLADKASQSPTASRAKALYRLGILEFYESDYPAVRALMSESLAIWRNQGVSGRLGVASALEMLAEAESETGDFSAAFPLYEQALDLFREIHDLSGIWGTLRMLGWSAMRMGQYEIADQRLGEALGVCRQYGDPHDMASTLAGMGELAIRRGQLQEAGSLLQESLNISRSIGDKWSIPISLGSLGWLALQKRDFTVMRSMLTESLSIRAETGDRGGIAWCLEKFGQAAILQSQYPRATTLLSAATALRAPVGSMMDPADQPEHERALSALREAVGEEAFAALWTEGEHMPLEAVLDFALQPPESEPADSGRLEKENFGGLTGREREAAAWIAQGKSNREIAEAMTVGVRTVETYVTRILQKLGFDSRVQIATWAVEKGLKNSNPQQ